MAMPQAPVWLAQSSVEAACWLVQLAAAPPLPVLVSKEGFERRLGEAANNREGVIVKMAAINEKLIIRDLLLNK